MTSTSRPGTTRRPAACATFPIAARRRGPAVDRSALHLQHDLLRLPRQPTGDQLRPGNRHLPHHLARGGHQLRVVPRSRRRAHPGHGGRRQRPHLARHQDHPHARVRPRADERHVRHLPRQTGAAVDRLHCRRQVLRPLRPDHAGAPRLLSRRPRPGRELHVHLLVDEPLPEVGQAGLQPVPHAQRPAAVRGQARPTSRACRATPASSRTPRPTAITRPRARATRASPATCR